MAVKAGEAFVELLLKSDKLKKGLNKASAQLKSFGKSVTMTGAQLIGISAALATPFVAGAKVFADFETSLAKVGTLLDNDEKQIESLGESVKQLSKDFGESTDTIASALFDIISATIPASKAIEVLTAAIKLSKAGFTDTATAASAVITVLKAYGDEAGTAAQVSDFLFQTAKFGRTTFEELAKSIGGVATIASLGGLSLDELGAALATITRAGLGTEEAVTSLRAVIVSFLKPADEASKIARKFGLELSSATLQTEGLAGVLARIEKLPADVIARIFPNVRALKAVLPLLKNLKDFNRDIKEIGNRAGVTEKALSRVTGTLTFLSGRVKQAGVAILRAFGSGLQRALKSSVGSILEFLNVVQKIVLNNGKLIVSAAKVTLAIGAIGAVLIVVGGAITAFGFFLSAVSTIIGVTVASLGLLVSAIVALFSPIGLGISLVVLLGSVVVAKFGLIARATELLASVFKRLQQIFSESFGAIVTAVKRGDLSAAFKVLTAAINLIWTKSIGQLQVSWAGFKDFVIKTAADAFIGVLTIINTVVAKIQGVWNTLIVGLTALLFKFKDKAADIFGDIVTFIAQVANEAGGGSESQKRAKFTALEELNNAEKKLREDIRKKQSDAILQVGKVEREQIERNKKVREAAINSIAALLKTTLAGDQQTEADKATANADKDLQKAKDEFRMAIENAEGKSTDQTGEGEDASNSVNDAFNTIKDEINNVRDRLSDFDLQALIGGAEDQTPTEGFNPFAIERRGAVEDFQRASLKVQKDNEKNTKDIRRNLQGGGVFQ